MILRTIILLTCIMPTYVFADLLLFSNDNKFHGCLDCGKYDSDSICNKYYDYGSKYHSNSIWNKYGIGNRYGYDSPFNKYGNGLKIVDRSGNFYGYFTMSYNGSRNARNLLETLWDSAEGDYGRMRDLYCNR